MCDESRCPAVFDREGFLERIGGSEAFLEKLVRSCIGSLTSHLDALADAVARNDAATIRMQAHAIRGAAANVGAGRMLELSEAMESAAQAGELSDMAESYAALLRAFAEFREVATASLRDQSP